jgi:hypothetical protein
VYKTEATSGRERLLVVALGTSSCYVSVLKCWQARVEGPCLHRPENWLVRQLSDKPKPVYKVGFIREKGKATAGAVQQSLEAGNSLLR